MMRSCYTKEILHGGIIETRSAGICAVHCFMQIIEIQRSKFILRKTLLFVGLRECNFSAQWISSTGRFLMQRAEFPATVWVDLWKILRHIIDHCFYIRS